MPLDVHIPRVEGVSRDPVAAMYLFGSFRSSERRKLKQLSVDNQAVFMDALEDFLERWASADWLEEYNVERVARWIAKNCSQELVDIALRHAEQKMPANQAHGLEAKSVHTRTYDAFAKGLHVSTH